MTTLDTLGTAAPDLDEVSDAALAMADYDAKAGDLGAALEWLAVAAHHRELTREYQDKRELWEGPPIRLLRRHELERQYELAEARLKRAELESREV
jgi:predicted ABC-class ATPase